MKGAAAMKAVFDTKPTSVYDDEVAERYHFPRRYLGLVRQCVGDWIVLRRPRADGGDLAYFATARVDAVEPDPQDPALSYARLSGFWAFDTPVPWRQGGSYAEEALRNMPLQQVGLYLRGRSVRAITDEDFQALIQAGFASLMEDVTAGELGIDPKVLLALGEPPQRQVEKVLTSRILRDASFRRAVCGAYDRTCAVTRLKILDAKGRSEAEAAHILPVAQAGPDVVQNGIALCRTVHWLFDHHLISLTDDYRLIVAHQTLPAGLLGWLVGQGEQIALPRDRLAAPHLGYLTKHRAAFERAQSLVGG